MGGYRVKGNGRVIYQTKKHKGNVPKEFKQSQLGVK